MAPFPFHITAPRTPARWCVTKLRTIPTARLHPLACTGVSELESERCSESVLSRDGQYRGTFLVRRSCETAPTSHLVPQGGGPTWAPSWHAHPDFDCPGWVAGCAGQR